MGNLYYIASLLLIGKKSRRIQLVNDGILTSDHILNSINTFLSNSRGNLFIFHVVSSSKGGKIKYDGKYAIK